MGAKNSIDQDLRFYAEITWRIDKGVQYAPSISGIPNLDTNYTLTFDNGGPDLDVTGKGGIVLEPTSSSIVLNFEANAFPQDGTYNGVLISESKVAGVYIRIKITVIVTTPS